MRMTRKEWLAQLTRRKAKERQSAAETIELLESRVAYAASDFEARWRYQTLRRINPDLYARFREQERLFSEACIAGEARWVDIHGSALLRAYTALTETMIAIPVPDDTAMQGTDPATGFRVVVVENEAAKRAYGTVAGEGASERPRYSEGGPLVATPDEIATLLAGLQLVADVTNAFPGAVIVRATAPDDIENDIENSDDLVDEPASNPQKER